MKRSGLAVFSMVLGLAGCVTAEQMDWARIGPGPDFEVALAQCRILSAGTASGMVAIGSPEYVLGSQIGNAIANDMAANRFIRDCMILQGWKGTAKRTKTP